MDYKILLVLPRQHGGSSRTFQYAFPLGLGYISAALKAAGFTVDGLNCNHEDVASHEAVSRRLDEGDYDLVGVGGNALMYPEIRGILEAAKNHPSKPVTVLGGLIATSEPEFMAENLKPDYIVLGEGEKSIVELALLLRDGNDASKVLGVGVLKGGKHFFNARRPEEKDLDGIAWPDYDCFDFANMLDNQRCNFTYINNVFDNPRVYPVLGSRGCPFNCTFCYHEESYRARSLEDVMAEIRHNVLKYRANILLFYDEVLALKPDRLLKLAGLIHEFRKELDWDLKWFPQLTVHNITSELIRKLKETGVPAVSYGFESMSPKVLASMKKPIKPGQITHAFKTTMAEGVGVLGNFIFGDIAETVETTNETLDWWTKHGKGQLGFGFIQPYPGSAIYHDALSRGVLGDKKEFIETLSNSSIYNMSHHLTDKEFKDLQEHVKKTRFKGRRFVTPKITSQAYKLELECPYCKTRLEYGNCELKDTSDFTYFMMCRECGMFFETTSRRRRFIYEHYGLYTIVSKIHGFFKRIKSRLR